MNRKKANAKVDPELRRQLNEAATGEAMIQAVFSLRLPAGKAVAPEAIEELAQQVLDRVTSTTGIKAGDVNVFRNLGSFVVAADKRFIHAMLGEPEIASAMANQQPESVFIQPQQTENKS